MFNCATCHKSVTPEIYSKWKSSDHATIFERGMNSKLAPYWDPTRCGRCHTTGYNLMANNSGYTSITCQTCHDPHSMELGKALASADTLANGFNYSQIDLGKGKLCVNCHKYRRNALTYVTTNLSAVWSPHHAGAGDVYLGQNGYIRDGLD